MNAAIRFLFAIGCISGTQGVAYAIQPGESVDNFRLLDQSGASHELHSNLGRNERRLDPLSRTLLERKRGCDG